VADQSAIYPFLGGWYYYPFLVAGLFFGGNFLLYGDRQVKVCGNSESLVHDPLAHPDETPGPCID